ncbi:MAG TPA: DUF4328 domain-containing protein [Brumimicrobium sp.]|nr:DUF4328 domain-containing protein [Brumimicrobium sp.]
MNKLRPNRTRAKTAITLIWIVMGIEILSLISGYFQSTLLRNADSGIIISMEEANANDLREVIIGLLYSLAFIISGITFIMWFRRAYFNLHLKVPKLSYGEGWAAGSWFVPILNWFRPFQIMSELYISTQKFLINKEVMQEKVLKKSQLGVWWTLWVINNLLGSIEFQFSRRAEEIEDFIFLTDMSMISNIIGIPLAIITVKVISDYARIEPLLFETEEDLVKNPFNIGSSSTLLDD